MYKETSSPSPDSISPQDEHTRSSPHLPPTYLTGSHLSAGPLSTLTHQQQEYLHNSFNFPSHILPDSEQQGIYGNQPQLGYPMYLPYRGHYGQIGAVTSGGCIQTARDYSSNKQQKSIDVEEYPSSPATSESLPEGGYSDVFDASIPEKEPPVYMKTEATMPPGDAQRRLEQQLFGYQFPSGTNTVIREVRSQNILHPIQNILQDSPKVEKSAKSISLPITPPGGQQKDVLDNTTVQKVPGALCESNSLSPPSSPSSPVVSSAGHWPWSQANGFTANHSEFWNPMVNKDTAAVQHMHNDMLMHVSDMDIASTLLRNPQLSAHPRKSKKCKCPNCEDVAPGANGEAKKRNHLCHVPGCNRSYSKTSHLKAHLRWHAGDRPFPCTWQACSKSFTRSDELQRHMRIHTGEKRFECSLCSKRFSRSDHLRKHTKIHENNPGAGKLKRGRQPSNPMKDTPPVYNRNVYLPWKKEMIETSMVDYRTFSNYSDGSL